jgi:hypothetical protein
MISVTIIAIAALIISVYTAITSTVNNKRAMKRDMKILDLVEKMAYKIRGTL